MQCKVRCSFPHYEAILYGNSDSIVLKIIRRFKMEARREKVRTQIKVQNEVHNWTP